MSKKAKKAARELQRLQQMYTSSDAVQPVSGIQTTPFPIKTFMNQSSAVSTHSYQYVRRDLIVLGVLIVVMIVALVGLNILSENTAFGDVLAKLVGKIF